MGPTRLTDKSNTIPDLLREMPTDKLLELISSNERANNEMRIKHGTIDEVSERLIETSILELASRKDRVVDLVNKFKSLSDTITNLNRELEDIYERNDRNWSVGSDKQIHDIKDKIVNNMGLKNDIEKLLYKIGYSTDGILIGTRGLIERTKDKFEQLDFGFNTTKKNG